VRFEQVKVGRAAGGGLGPEYVVVVGQVCEEDAQEETCCCGGRRLVGLFARAAGKAGEDVRPTTMNWAKFAPAIEMRCGYAPGSKGDMECKRVVCVVV
jgi:hypothetical protein